jgi:hypothetical protein
MTREFTITPNKTYATIDNARKAVAKSGKDSDIRHTFMRNEEDRWFPVFFPKEGQLSETGIHFRWNVVL